MMVRLEAYTVITCPKCTKDNQDHYKFCLGCGAELPRELSRDVVAPKAFNPQTPHGLRVAPRAAPPAPSPSAYGSGSGGGTAALPKSPPSANANAKSASAAHSASSSSSADDLPPVLAPPSAGQRPSPLPAVLAPPPPTAAASNVMAGIAKLQAQSQAAHVHAPPAAASVLADAAAVPGAVKCAQCGHVNTTGNLFCGSCGGRLSSGGVSPRTAAPAPLPAALQPAVGNVALMALRADGTEAGVYQLPSNTSTIGRETGSVFAADSYLSPRHATFRILAGGKLTVKDEGSLNGVYKKLTRDVPVSLKPTDIFRMGQEIIRFEPLVVPPPSPDAVERIGAPAAGVIGRIALVIGRETTGSAFPVLETGMQLGRERGDVLFPEDGYVSGLHCKLDWEPETGCLLLTDLGSSNGTFVRLREETDVRTGDVLLMGQQLFRVTM